MAHETVVNTTETYLGAVWDRSPIVGVIRKDARSNQSSTFLAVQYPIANPIRLIVSEPYYQEEGGIRLVLSCKRDTDPSQMLRWGSELASLFRDKSVGGVKYLVPTSPFIDDSNDNGNFYVLTIVVPYTFDFRG